MISNEDNAIIQVTVKSTAIILPIIRMELMKWYHNNVKCNDNNNNNNNNTKNN